MFEKNKTILTTGPYMRRFFFSIDEAVDLVKFALENSHNFSGKIISTEMKSSLIIDVLKVWIKKYGGKYNIVKSRKGDRDDEFLFGFNEIDYVYKIKKNNKIYYVIDFNKKAKNPIKKIISSKNTKKLNESEILKIIQLGMH
jgi:FlaA1/EpsC-like NDP-sugar epimerase